jgi:hypothetical protein
MHTNQNQNQCSVNSKIKINMKQTIKKQIRIPFTLEAMKNPNAQFVLRDGTPIESNALTFLPDYYEHYAIRGLFDGIDGLEEYELWTNEGKYNTMVKEHSKDLLEVIEVEEVIENIKRIEFTEEEVFHLLFTIQSAQDSFGDKKIFPEDSPVKISYNNQLESWINQADSLYKKIALQRWIELPTPPDSYYTNQNK